MTEVPPEIVVHYEDTFDEAGRLLSGGWGQVELLRTQELIRRFVPEPPATVIDVGGGPGVHAAWLADEGYEVHLIDPVPRHVASARVRPEPIAGVVEGDARSLPYPENSYDAALLLGPLYHLIDRPDRMEALAEAHRVVRPGGPILGAAISRFASSIDGLNRGFIDDPEFGAIVARDLVDGVHLNPSGNPQYFTTAYFHHADELRQEFHEAGFERVDVLAIEGIAWAAPDLDERMADPRKGDQLLDVIRELEREPTLLGATGHLLAVGHVPA